MACHVSLYRFSQFLPSATSRFTSLVLSEMAVFMENWHQGGDLQNFPISLGCILGLKRKTCETKGEQGKDIPAKH